MKSRKLAKRLKRLERRVAELEAGTHWRFDPVQIEGPEVDPHLLLRDAVVDWMHYWEDDGDEEWSPNGYL